MIRKVELKLKKLMADVFFPDTKGIIKSRFGEFMINESQAYAEVPGGLLIFDRDNLPDIFEVKKDKTDE